MPKVALDAQTQTAETLISTYGCLGRKHMVTICGGDEDQARRSISFMIRYGAIRTTNDEQILKPQLAKNQKVDMSTLDCITVALDLLKGKEEIDDEALDALSQSFENKPVKIAFIDKDNVYVNIVPLNSSNISSSLSILKDRYSKNHKGDKDKGSIIYVFVLRDKSLLSEIGSSGISFAHKIALISTENGEEKVKYFNPKNKE